MMDATTEREQHPTDPRSPNMTETETQTTILATTVDTHLAGYCEPDPGARRRLLDQVWAPEAALIDPPLEGVGVAAIAGLVDAVLAHYPAHRFVRTTEVDAHHDFVRYGWELRAPDGVAAVSGLDFAELDATGRITRIVGFFGDLVPDDATTA
jgi:hypothetical protein